MKPSHRHNLRQICRRALLVWVLVLVLVLVAVPAAWATPLTAASEETPTDYVCNGANHVATIQRVVQPNGIPIEMEKITVTTKTDRASAVWVLWSHRDGENWSERSLLEGVSRKGMRFVLNGFQSYLYDINLDLPWPDGERIVDIGTCWWVTRRNTQPAR